MPKRINLETHTAVRLPVPLKERIQRIAKKEQAGTSEIMRHALRKFADEYEFLERDGD